MTKSGTSNVRILVFALSILLISCAPNDNQQLAMCQDVTQELLQQSGLVWDKHEQSQDENELRINIAFTSAGNQPMQTQCIFPVEEKFDEDYLGDTVYDGAPATVSINGKAVDQRSLIQANLRATKKAFKETAQETVKQTRELADEASEKARQVSEQVGEKARKAALDAAANVQRTLGN